MNKLDLLIGYICLYLLEFYMLHNHFKRYPENLMNKKRYICEVLLIALFYPLISIPFFIYNIVICLNLFCLYIFNAKNKKYVKSDVVSFYKMIIGFK